MPNQKRLLFGYMPSLEEDLLQEIKFAKRFFDFTEITLKRNLSCYNGGVIDELREGLTNFVTLGHIHWETNLTNQHELQYVFSAVKIHSSLGAKKITVHPSSNEKLAGEDVIEINNAALKKINRICEEKNIQLSVENSTLPPFNRMGSFEYFLSKIPSLEITLDIGHANITEKNGWEKYYELFKNKIGHVHLHHNDEQDDHLPFSNPDQIIPILTKISQSDILPTVTLEIFRERQNQKILSLSPERRKKILINQLEMIKNSGFL